MAFNAIEKFVLNLFRFPQELLSQHTCDWALKNNDLAWKNWAYFCVFYLADWSGVACTVHPRFTMSKPLGEVGCCWRHKQGCVCPINGVKHNISADDHKARKAAHLILHPKQNPVTALTGYECPGSGSQCCSTNLQLRMASRLPTSLSLWLDKASLSDLSVKLHDATANHANYATILPLHWVGLAEASSRNKVLLLWRHKNLIIRSSDNANAEGGRMKQ